MKKPLRVLILEDSEDDTFLVRQQLKRDGYDLYSRRVETPQDMREALRVESWDVILSDYNMPAFDAPAALEILR